MNQGLVYSRDKRTEDRGVTTHPSNPDTRALMASPKTKALHREDPDRSSTEKPLHNGKEVNTASVALAAAVAKQKPNPVSKAMLRLYGIMTVGYLVSTINGFGKRRTNHHPSSSLPQSATNSPQTAPSWVPSTL